jgi:2'-5' RNA ligase
MGLGELEEEDPRSLTVRAFFGLPVPEPQRAELARFVAACAELSPDFRWTPMENLHLTIRFVGSVQRAVIEAVADALERRALAAFEMELGEVGTFGRGRAARVVWLGLRGGGEAAGALAAAVEEECLEGGIAPESRPYQAHLTLARARARGGARLPELPPIPRVKPWRVNQLILYSSRLARAGAVYEPMRTLKLV